MNIAPPARIVASENPLWFVPKAGMALCCPNPAEVIATQGAMTFEVLKSRDFTGQLALAEPTGNLSGWLRIAEIQSPPD
jgi:hypothetical protein